MDTEEIENTNCLQGMRCPQCGANEPFHIDCSCTFTFRDDGTEPTGDVEYEDDSFIACEACGHTDIVKTFMEENQKKTEPMGGEDIPCDFCDEEAQVHCLKTDAYACRSCWGDMPD